MRKLFRKVAVVDVNEVVFPKLAIRKVERGFILIVFLERNDRYKLLFFHYLRSSKLTYDRDENAKLMFHLYECFQDTIEGTFDVDEAGKGDGWVDDFGEILKKTHINIEI